MKNGLENCLNLCRNKHKVFGSKLISQSQISTTDSSIKKRQSIINHNKHYNINFILIFIISILLVKPTKENVFKDEDCIAENNKNFDFHKPYSRNIENPNQCTEKSPTCCYVEINYDYAGHLINNNFCVLLGGDVNLKIQELQGILTDQIRYYSNFIYNNYESITSIGNNLDFVFHENYTCYEREQDIDFYYYIQDNCAVTNSDGTCKIVNDLTYKDNYMKLLYEDITNNFCNNKDPLGNCINYKDSPDFNETGLTPLLEYLKASLDLYENSTDAYKVPEIDPVMEKKNNTELSKKFYQKCNPIVPAKVKIICPSSYVDGYFFNLNKYNHLFMIALIFLFF